MLTPSLPVYAKFAEHSDSTAQDDRRDYTLGGKY